MPLLKAAIAVRKLIAVSETDFADLRCLIVGGGKASSKPHQ